MPVVEKNVVITNAVGLHARPAALLVQEAGRFQARVQIRYGEKSTNARSLIGVLKLGARKGADLVIQADGEDADEAVQSLVALIERKFDEE